MSREMMVLFSLVCLHVLWVILPLIPSILIYRLFPNTAVAVSGPLANLTVRASGAFAAYLIIFVFTYPLIQTTKEAIGGFQHQFWTINGQVKIIDARGMEVHSQSLLKKIAVLTDPVAYSIQSYYLRVKVMQSEGDDFPLLIFQIPSFGERVIDLKSIETAAVDNYKKTIIMKEPIIIQEALQSGPVAAPARELPGG